MASCSVLVKSIGDYFEIKDNKENRDKENGDVKILKWVAARTKDKLKGR